MIVMSEGVLILKSGVCGWGGCMFCGYGRIHGHPPTYENLRREFDLFFGGLNASVDVVKVFGSGSFFDERQVPARARKYFIKKCREKRVRSVTVESRPEYITENRLAEFGGLGLTVALGLESADDVVLGRVNKGFRLEDYERAADTIKSVGAKVRTYLLVNIPGVGGRKLDESVEFALKHSDSVVLINLLPHGNTPLFRLWLSGEWNFLDEKQFRMATSKWRGHPKVELDFETFRFIPHFPPELRKPLSGVGEEYLTHPYFEVWQDYLLRFYRPRKKIVLFLPCTHKKPYSESSTHERIIRILDETRTRELVHEVMISNAGVIPREFEDNYPFNAYDWDERLETPEIKKRYVEVTAKRIGNYLRAHKKYYKHVYCYLNPESDSYKALEKACSKNKLTLKNLLTQKTYDKIKDDKKILQKEEALEDLKKGLIWLRQNSMR